MTRGNLILRALALEAKNAEGWWWLSFAGEEGWRGVVVTRARGLASALQRTHRLHLNPGGQVSGALIPHPTAPPAAMVDRLITDREELNRLSMEWTGEGIVRLPDDSDDAEYS